MDNGVPFQAGRFDIDLFENAHVISESYSYHDVKLVVNNEISKGDFSIWVEKRWEEITRADIRRTADHAAQRYSPFPNAAWFKFGFMVIDYPKSGDFIYEAEDAIWLNNKAVFLAPQGMPQADKVIPSMLEKMHERGPEDKVGKFFCAKFYCLDMPAAEREIAKTCIEFPGIEG